MAATYDIGDVVRISSAFSQNGAPFDPTTVNLKVLLPDATSTVTTYPAPAMKRDTAGAYYVDVEITQRGTYRYRWYSTGLGQTAAEAWFQARPQQVP